MRDRGHAGAASNQMAASRFIPAVGVIALLMAGAVTDMGALLTLEDVAMLPSMLAGMLFRRDKRSGAHSHASASA
jgi:hypothetical protein